MSGVDRENVKRRCVITGIGMLSPVGATTTDFWRSVMEGRSGISDLTRFSKLAGVCQVAGEVSNDFLRKKLDARTLRTTAHATQLAMIATAESLQDAAISPNQYLSHELGVFVGTAVGGWVQGEQQYSILLEKGAQRLNPFLASGSPSYSIGAEIAFLAGATGPQVTYASGCVSSTQAIGSAAISIFTGETAFCLSGGTESPLSPMILGALSRSGELSTSNVPETASRPFDRKHDGMVLSEGACFLVLESAEKAITRGAHIYAEILGAATSCDAKGLYQIDRTGESGARAIHSLLRKYNLAPTDIDYICANANSSPTFDRKELQVLTKAFGEFAPRIAISSIKGVLGHPFGASGAFQTAAAALSICNGQIPANHNLEAPEIDCELDLVRDSPRNARLGHVLVTSYGYGGLNSYLLLGRYEP